MTEIVTVTVNPTVDRSATVDRVVPDKKLSCHDEQFDPGGGGLNVASAVHQLGGEASALWTCGGGIGELLKDLLRTRGVKHQPIPVEQPTRENVIIYEAETEQQFRFGMPGPKLSDQEQQAIVDHIGRLDPVPKYLVLSGSLPPGVPDDFYGQIIQAAPQQSRIVLDTRGAALQKGVQQSVFLLKPNQRELGELAGREIQSDAEARDAATALIEQGKVQVVLVSLGRGGILLVTADQQHRVAAPTVNIRSKIGAGDSTVAGAVLALARGDSLLEATRFAVACGSAAVMTEGTQLCRREDAERLYREITEESKQQAQEVH